MNKNVMVMVKGIIMRVVASRVWMVTVMAVVMWIIMWIVDRRSRIRKRTGRVIIMFRSRRKMRRRRIPMLRVIKGNRKRRMIAVRASARRSRHLASGVSTSDVGRRKSTRKSVQRSSMQNIVSSARHVTKVMSVMTFVNFVNKYILVQGMHKMTINGLDVMNVTGG